MTSEEIDSAAKVVTDEQYLTQKQNKEYSDSITRIRLANFYRRLSDAVNDEMSHGAIYAMHKDATELLKKLR